MTPPPATPSLLSFPPVSLLSFPPVVSGNPSSSLTRRADGRNRPRTLTPPNRRMTLRLKAKKILSTRHHHAILPVLRPSFAFRKSKLGQHRHRRSTTKNDADGRSRRPARRQGIPLDSLAGLCYEAIRAATFTIHQNISHAFLIFRSGRQSRFQCLREQHRPGRKGHPCRLARVWSRWL